MKKTHNQTKPNQTKEKKNKLTDTENGLVFAGGWEWEVGETGTEVKRHRLPVVKGQRVNSGDLTVRGAFGPPFF